MRSKRLIILGILSLFVFESAELSAQINGDDSLLAARGKGTVSHDEFSARADRIPEEHRFPVIRDRARMQDMLDNLLLVGQLTADAEAAGFDADPMVIKRMALAAKEELAKAWVDHYIESKKDADYAAMARETYQLNRGNYMTEHTVDVSHILIGTDVRSEEEALEIATSLRAQLEDDPGRFDTLVREFSDDESKANNKGSFKGILRGDMVEPFETVAFSLATGEISEPVLTQYGYHIVRKDGDAPPRQRNFGEVRLALEQQARREHRERERTAYLQSLYDEELIVTQESVENTIERVFGPEVLARYSEEGETP